MQASILAIGTEVTSGQINNSNAQWISSRLKQYGIVTALHLAVPDERRSIQKALDFASDQNDLIFVTGGLGPTSDDLTRLMISEWTQQELQYNEAAWKHIEQRLIPRGIPVQEIQRQQCYFPRGSQILTNQMGTAHGFMMALPARAKTVFVLPGPPREIAAVWEDHIQPWLRQNTKNLDKTLTWSWDCLGVPESEVARRAEVALVDCQFEKAYRVHLPYVEFKMSFLQSEQSVAEAFAKRLDQAFADVTFLREGQDLAKQLCQILDSFPRIKIVDSLSNGFLLHRIYPFAKTLLQNNKIEITPHGTGVQNSEGLVLELTGLAEHSAQASLRLEGRHQSKVLASIFSSPLLLERENQYFTELAFQFWLGQLGVG